MPGELENGLEGLSVASVVCKCLVTGSPCHRGHNLCRSPPALFQNADPAPRLPRGSQQDAPGREVFPAKQREPQFSEGPLSNIIHVIHARTRTPKPPSAEAPPRRGAGRRTLSEHGQKSRVHIVSTVLSSTEGWAQGCSQQGRQILRLPCHVPAGPRVGQSKAPGGRDSRRGDLSPLLSPLPSFRLAICPSSIPRQPARPPGMARDLGDSPPCGAPGCERERDMGVDCRDAREREGGRCCQEELHWR